MVTTSAERVAKHRLSKKADAFSAEYMSGHDVAIPDEFILAKEAEFIANNKVFSVVFDQDFLDIFLDQLIERECEDNLYIIDDMIDCWQLAEKEY
jgi:hypothetical protein